MGRLDPLTGLPEPQKFRLNCKRFALLSGTAARAFAGLAQLTPARVDLMVLVLHYEFSQKMLAELLCVSDAVVSRMVTALVKLNLVRRRIPDDDRRLRLVHITDTGREKLRPLLQSPTRCCSGELRLPEDGSRGAQCMGEQIFHRDWRALLELWGVDLRCLERCERPPVRMLRERNRHDPYWRIVRGARVEPVRVVRHGARWSTETFLPRSWCSVA